ncbi:Uncharacterized protein DAT39_001903 [Clarias magur]|uniref:Uncharacterized protein n=1 Tax=Clarias magur TaxID=1594786 RepID=A0A8J4XGD1_CLAMG|nr:Uncharacterized protein DAT39_001903 [Clarias magur]
MRLLAIKSRPLYSLLLPLPRAWAKQQHRHLVASGDAIKDKEDTFRMRVSSAVLTNERPPVFEVILRTCLYLFSDHGEKDKDGIQDPGEWNRWNRREEVSFIFSGSRERPRAECQQLEQVLLGEIVLLIHRQQAALNSADASWTVIRKWGGGPLRVERQNDVLSSVG